MVDTEITLPAIDMGKARDPDLRREVARQLVHALETVGFVFIENVVGFEPHTLLDKARWFFSLPDAQKQEVARKLWNPLSKNHYRGYFPLQEGEVSYKEGYEIGREVPENTQHMPDDLQVHPFFQEPNMWPGSAEGGEQFRTQLLTHYNAALQCGAEVLRLVSLGSGLKDDWFQSLFFPNSLSTLRLLHYPPRPGVVSPTARDGETVLCCSDHSDSGLYL
ncbi:hypothetical protein BaRGS_00019676 [Batillaria attramentaria]|uniref:Non-haem dioxygenase N-terminal domain-containing protein n=1 Tax=Batillaria attramentaria TaxID=370345 RepID=A0ABD0KP51_9CAEN